MRKFDIDFNTTYLAGSCHLWHNRPFVYSTRGFASVGEHDKWVRSQLEGLPEGSLLISLGNLFFHPDWADLVGLVRDLANNGIRLLALEGNHDHKYLWSLKREHLIDLAGDMALVSDGDQNAVLSHYPLSVWPQHNFGYYHFHAHTRGVGVDAVPGRADCSVDVLKAAVGRPYISIADAIARSKYDQTNG